MADTRFCTAGRNQDGAWFIACKIDGSGSQALLDANGYRLDQSQPPDSPYDNAARHIRDQGGLFWTTNAPGEYVTIAGVPDTDRQ
ncbi:hypothetical protein [Actibacterium sp. XHP0104]|uniref:hypothetical protein n=1 Tax=Actibacterium sp. XHP0104 TaxID=2984335 RepID=UPI0021E80A35|nr:hypothetical protein [Actibacterium sp. XHP0104]MCV2881270.1 hypothetical protein [Actibacterium sp. XHP0104]